MKPALLLVDLQGDFLAAPALQPVPAILIARAAALLDGCRRRAVPVLHIWTTLHRADDRRLPHWKSSQRWHCVAGTPGHQTPDALQPAPRETIIHKSGFNGFAGGTLDAALKAIGCDTVILAGVHLHTCVRTLAAEGLERGLHVLTADDAVASNDPVYAAATRRWLAERTVEFVSTREILGRLDGNAPSQLIHYSPRNFRRILFEIPLASATDLAAATRSAHDAWAGWRRTPVRSRCETLSSIADRLEAAAPDWARQMAVETGKPLAHGLEEIHRTAANLRDVLARAAAFEFQTRAASGLVRYEPVGVVALISPWNNPVAVPLGKIVPALVYGNTVVWKPAPAATKIAVALLQLLRQAGVPAGAVQLVTGDHRTAQSLAADGNIGAVTLTGAAPAGWAILEICARRFLPLQAELSGNNAAIVWDDADLPSAAHQLVRAAFGFAGQRCTANRRVIVSADRFEALWRELKTAAEKLHWGDPLKKNTDIGPLLDAGRRAAHTGLVQSARDSGAAHRLEFLFAARARAAWVRAGAYAQPVLAACDDDRHELVQEETMSPLLIVQRAGNFEHALQLCNGVRHGLVAALFSDVPERRAQFLAEARAGLLKLNTATAGADAALPFGGWKMSGLGPPEHGEADRLFYTRLQVVYGADIPGSD